MSTQPTNDHHALLDANGIPIETWGGKFERKFKENPFVPVLAGLTTVSLVVAASKLRKRDSVALNHWFRVRVVMQGLTVAAVVAGSWWYGQMKHQKEALAAAEQDRLIERAAFQARLRAAEEADRLERMEAEVQANQAAAKASSSASGWTSGWWGKSGSNNS